MTDQACAHRCQSGKHCGGCGCPGCGYGPYRPVTGPDSDKWPRATDSEYEGLPWESGDYCQAFSPHTADKVPATTAFEYKGVTIRACADCKAINNFRRGIATIRGEGMST
jgi:hypothetical protein